MYLGGVKARGRGVVFDFFRTATLPQRLTESKLEALVVRLRQGDTGVMDDIVKGHMRLAMQIVSRYHAKIGIVDLCEDLLGEAFLALVHGCRAAQTRLVDNNITPYLISKVHSAISNYLANAKTISIPRTTYNKYNGMLKPPKVEPLQDKASNQDIVSEVIGEELSLRCCTNPMQRDILQRRLSGESDMDIARVAGVSRSTITRLRQQIGENLTALRKG